MIHYYLCRERDNFLRIGIEGSKEAAEEYFTKHFDSVEFIDTFVDVIYTDVDTEVGIGQRKYPEFTIRTCRYIYQLRTKKDAGDYFKYLKEAHKKLKESVREAWERKEGIRMRREAKVNEDGQSCR